MVLDTVNTVDDKPMRMRMRVRVRVRVVRVVMMMTMMMVMMIGAPLVKAGQPLPDLDPSTTTEVALGFKKYTGTGVSHKHDHQQQH